MLEKNKILNFQHLKNVKLAKVQDQNQAMMQVHALCVVVMVKLDQTKDFFNGKRDVINLDYFDL